MANQQSAETTGEASTQGRSELTRLGGIILGLGLLLGALNNQAVQLSNQLVPQLPAPGVLIGRIVVGAVGVVLGLWGLAGLLEAERRLRELQAWRARRQAPKPPEEPGPSVGRPPDRNPLFTDRKTELERLKDRLAKERRVDLSGLGGVGKSSLVRIPTESGHPFRLNPGTCSDESGHPWKEAVA